MSSSTFHILNGDSLENRFPKVIKGNILVCRECFIDGNVQGETLQELYKNRITFLDTYFPEKKFGLQDYNPVISEFEKIKSIPNLSEINFWFEEDLFCQINWWFVLSLVKANSKNYKLNLVLPSKEHKFSFCNMTDFELEKSFDERIEINNEEFLLLSQFWKAYQQKSLLVINKLSEKLGEKYAFMHAALKALKENKAKSSLIELLDSLNTNNFWLIFKAFQEREAVYGLGDLQVKRLLNEIRLEKETKNN